MGDDSDNNICVEKKKNSQDDPSLVDLRGSNNLDIHVKKALSKSISQAIVQIDLCVPII